MRRNCDVARVRDMLLELKSINPVKISTSIIVGFPSETREELNDTIEFCEQVGFDQVICHGFSARPETVAAKLPGQLSPEEILERSRFVKSRLHNKTVITTEEDHGDYGGYGNLLQKMRARRVRRTRTRTSNPY